MTTRPFSKRERLSRRQWLRAGAALLGAPLLARAATPPRRVVVWSECTAPPHVYPDDINGAIAAGLKPLLRGWNIETANLFMPEQGCSRASLDRCDVLIWWGHKRHARVKDEYVDRIERRVKEDGMGFIAVHSAHFAKPNKRLMGTRCSWAAYKTDGCRLKVHVNEPQHPVTRGVKDFTLPRIERYSEPYQVPEPAAVPLTGAYVHPDGRTESTRVGLCWRIGQGRMFYLSIGHETYPNLYRPEVQQIFANAVQWAAPER
jgi:trehalose utilization protein